MFFRTWFDLFLFLVNLQYFSLLLQETFVFLFEISKEKKELLTKNQNNHNFCGTASFIINAFGDSYLMTSLAAVLLKMT